MNDRLATAEPATTLSPLKPWGFWGSILWALAAVGAQYAVIFSLVLGWGLLTSNWAELEMITPVSPVIWLATILAVPAQVWVLMRAARRRGGGPAYLALLPPRGRDIAVGVVVVLALIAVFDLVTYALGRDVVPPFLIDAYRVSKSAGALPVLVLAVAVAAPLWEELLFRGFLYEGFSHSRFGPIGAIVLTSLIWAVMHIQYDWFGIVQITVIGFVFGWLRLRSGSTLLTIPLHMLANAIALAETAIKLEWLA